MKTGHIIVHRKKNIIGLLVNVDLYLDDQPLGKLKDGEKQDFEVVAGKHILKARQANKSGAIEIDVKENMIRSYAFRQTYITYITVISPITAIVLSKAFQIPYFATVALFAPGILTAIYTLTLGRKKYFIFELTRE